MLVVPAPLQEPKESHDKYIESIDIHLCEYDM